MMMSGETRPLLDDRRQSVVAASPSSSPSFPPSRSNSDPSAAPAAAAAAARTAKTTAPQSSSKKKQAPPTKSSSSSPPPLLSCLVYAVVNVVIAVPSLYGYAAVIFQHPIYHPYRNQLAKLVISSSLVHQLGFTMFSSLPFAIGMVQDAGLVFLSAMSGTIADRVLLHGGHHNHKTDPHTGSGSHDDDDTYDHHHDPDEFFYNNHDAAIVLSTTMVLLSLGTAVLGLILMALGKFRLANAVSFLPFGAVGGYLAFIGWFCIQAGTSLAISAPLDSLADAWELLGHGHEILLAAPALLAGLLLAVVARNVSHGAALPTTMVVIPLLFYLVLFVSGCSMDRARDFGWVGALSSSVSSSSSDETTTAMVEEELQPTIATTISIWTQFDLSLVRWDLITELTWTWIGMVFVVSFASCLDVAAISMDLGEPLDTNQELTTVGLCNLMSGLAGGYTGSYIFSQTIFTFRTGVHSRWIGIFVMVFFAAVIASPMDILSVSPLFFFGATLIFIGFDLLYEWFYVIRHNVSLAEYGTIWGTFFAIQVVGIDFGIIVGIFFAIVEHVTATAQTTDVHRVGKRSRAIWSPEEFQVLNDHAYNSVWPKIVTLEVSGPCFFGSSVGLLQKMIRELGLDTTTTTTTTTTDQDDAPARMVARSPHVSASMLASPVVGRQRPKGTLLLGTRRPPQFCVMDLTQVSNVDASAARGCFLALSRMASKHGITIVACGASPRIDWVLRSHDASYDTNEAEQAKERLHRRSRAALNIASSNDDPPAVKILMFLTSYEALEFCESLIVEEIHYPGENRAMPTKFGPTIMEQTLSSIFARLIGATPHEQDLLKTFDQGRYHSDVYFNAGERIFIKDAKSEAFYVVLEGVVASGKARANVVYRNRQEIVTGAGFLAHQHRQGRSGSSSDLLDPALSDHVFPSAIATMFPVGAIFGYTDVFLGRPRSFEAFVTKSCKVARIDQGHLQALRHEDPVLNGLLHRVLVKVCVLDLANCTCDDT